MGVNCQTIGDTLKFMILRQKVYISEFIILICDRFRICAKVTNHKMHENKMGNRVAKSKSSFLDYYFCGQSLVNLFVKVQRVYGSFCIGFYQ